jgi:Protein of unknown function (DUF2975)
MSLPQESALRVSRRVLRALVVVNVLYGLAILVLLVASFVGEDAVMGALGVRPAADREVMVRGMRLVAFFGILAVPLLHVILNRLLRIVDTVRGGDPFIVDNARRLETIARTLLGVQLLHLVIGAIAARTRSEVQQLDIDWNFSMTPWIAVLLLFVLARVFEHGARMRADLEGTV